MATDKTHHHTRDLQIMPADGWWAIFAQDDGTFERERLIGFALTEQWQSADARADRPDDTDHVERVVVPLTWQDGYIDHEEGENLVAVVHVDDWDDATAARLAQEYADRRRQREAARR